MKILTTSGKRKRAIARATIREGKGVVTINGADLSIVQPLMSKSKIREPLVLAGDVAKKYDIAVRVAGGGVSAQADACRLAVAKALTEITKNDKLKDIFLKYDRQLLVADVRRKEPSKPNRHGQARAKRQKSYR
ncbi:MAG: 30S ribosomal protein S9 [Candidatus Peribacteraceae bacterium]|jgi:small subunit ribosomal protein S9|nr:30S ribosomal protein S9 [Candidatus Peribacteraceae bacterium]|tara:strand:+ start:345 stop:746 length:402 start_codon:yes stop_codon:yes gene_type:complete